jgi:hypothetical protein
MKIAKATKEHKRIGTTRMPPLARKSNIFTSIACFVFNNIQLAANIEILRIKLNKKYFNSTYFIKVLQLSGNVNF